MNDNLVEILAQLCDDDIHDLAEAYPDESRSLEVSVSDLMTVDCDVAGDVLSRPDHMTEVFEGALAEYDDVGVTMATANVRFTQLPEEHTMLVGNERARHLHRLIALEGQIVKRTEVNPKIDEACFVCVKCETKHFVKQGFGNIQNPGLCTEPVGPEGGACRSSNFYLLKDESTWIDHQIVQLQQPPEEALDGGTAKMNIHLLDDICGDVETGMRATFVGKYIPWPNKGRTRHKKIMSGSAFEPEQRAYEEVDTSEYADEIRELAESDQCFERIVDALAPGHQGDRHVKQAVALQIFGGWSRTAQDGTFHRGNSHILMIGDPGVGKSNLIEAAAEVSPRGVKTDGTGSSSAGLTAAITKDSFGDESFTIEAGTLVRANKGLAAVDEIDKGDTSDLDALHTALETQKVYVNKAGRHAILPAETALLAAGNPREGHFDFTKDFASQVDLKSPLLSRFDLVFVMTDKQREETVRRISEHMITTRQTAGKIARGEDVPDADRSRVEPSIPREVLTAYIAQAKKNIKPVIRDDALEDRMREWFVTTKTTIGDRTDGDAPPLPVTARKLDAIQRLAEASARTRLDDTIRSVDLERARVLIERSLADIGIAPTKGESLGRVGDIDTGEVGLS